MQRITITIEDDLLAEIDAAAKDRGYQNRSEIIRDLARAGLQQGAQDAMPSGQCVAALVYVYDHAARDLSKRLVQNFHGHHDLSLATLHVHLDDDSCMEVTALKGASGDVKHLAEHPDIIAVLKEADERNISTFGNAWHSDFSFLEEPPMGSVLYGREIPSHGGDTLFANMYEAYDALSDGMKRLLDGLRAIHVGRPYGRGGVPADLRTSRSIAIERDNPAADREIDDFMTVPRSRPG